MQIKMKIKTIVCFIFIFMFIFIFILSFIFRFVRSWFEGAKQVSPPLERIGGTEFSDVSPIASLFWKYELWDCWEAFREYRKAFLLPHESVAVQKSGWLNITGTWNSTGRNPHKIYVQARGISKNIKYCRTFHHMTTGSIQKVAKVCHRAH